jgi:hypothetical protein
MNPAVVSSLAQHLTDRQLENIRTWLNAMRNDLEIKTARTISEPELAGHLSNLFDDLVDYLQNPGAEDSEKIVREEARKHGNQRWHQRYRLAELLREIAIIRRLIMVEGLASFFRLRPEYSGHHDDARELIDQFFENVTAASVEQYVENFVIQLNEAARSLAEANDRLRETDKSRLSSIPGIAHDLANFVNALNWAVESFALPTDENDRARLLHVLRQNVEDVRSLLHQLTDHSILRAGEFHL